MTTAALPCWVDGRLLARDDPALRLDDSAFLEGRGCYTTARVVAGRPQLVERHLRRLRGDAARLGLQPVGDELLRRALTEVARAAFGGGDGAVRLQLSRDGHGRSHLVALPRHLGDEPASWRAIVAAFPHPGALGLGGAKVTGQLAWALARQAAAEAGVEEAILLDGDGRLVEGSRSNLLVVTADGTPRTPPAGRGPVCGVGRELLLERCAELREADVHRDELAAASEVIAVSALRGPHAITRIDGQRVGAGRPGPLSSRLQRLWTDPQ